MDEMGLGAAAQGAAPQPPQQPARGQIPEASYKPGTGEDGSRATPEQQRQYNQFVGAGIQMMNSKKFLTNAVKFFKKTDDPGQAVAQIVSNVASHLYMSAKKAGKPLDGAVVLHGGAELFERAMEIADAAGKPVPKDQVETAFYKTADMFRSTLDGAGQIDKEQAKRMIEDFRMMDSRGELDDIASEFAESPRPPLGQRPEPAPAPEQEQPPQETV